MSLGLLLAISIGNIALAFYTTQVFRRDSSLRRRQTPRAIARQTCPGSPRDQAAPPGEELPSASAAREKRAIPQLEPGGHHPVEDLYFHAHRLSDFLAEIDHSVVSGQAGEQSTEEQLASMWPQLAKKAKLIEEPLQEAAADTNASGPNAKAAGLFSLLMANGTAILEQSRSLAEEMGTAEKRRSNAESGMHHLRDLFQLACEFRDQCEDMLADGLGIDPPTDSTDGRLAFQRKAAQLASSESPVCAVGLELDHVGELNGMHGATIINALLNELERKINANRPEAKAICRYHSQYYLVLVEGDTRSAVAWADVLRQQVASTRFRGEQHLIEATLSGVVVPLSTEPETLVSRLAAAMGESKQEGYNRIARVGKKGLEAVITT